MIKIDPERTRAIKELKRPETIADWRSFLGIANFCGEFLPRFSVIAAPLEDQLKGETKRSKKKIQWSEESMQAYTLLKKRLVETTERNIADLKKKFILITDTLAIAIGAILA